MAEWKAPLPGEAKEGNSGHPEDHNKLTAAIEEVRTNVDTAGTTADWGKVSNKPTIPSISGLAKQADLDAAIARIKALEDAANPPAEG